jgi:nucleotidyltransferase substrate binding protein (TIGR01987 family)
MTEGALVGREFSRALERLKSGAAEDLQKSDLVADGVIQRFEFTFELGWKLMKAILLHQGLECASPRHCIKEAARIGMISDGDAWIEMLGPEPNGAPVRRAAIDEGLPAIKDRYLKLLSELESNAGQE